MNLILWYIPLGLLALLFWVLLRRHAYRCARGFLSSSAFAVAAGVARFAVHNHPRPYHATYWITEAGYDLLGILVMYEVLRTVLGNLTRSWWARLIFPVVLDCGHRHESWPGLTSSRLGLVAPLLYRHRRNCCPVRASIRLRWIGDARPSSWLSAGGSIHLA